MRYSDYLNQVAVRHRSASFNDLTRLSPGHPSRSMYRSSRRSVFSGPTRDAHYGRSRRSCRSRLT